MIYKYLPPDRTSYLSDGLLRFTQPIALNDPYEGLPALSVRQTHEVVDKYIASEKMKANQAPTREARKRARELVTRLKNKIQMDLKKNPDFLWQIFFRNAHIKINSQIGILSLSERWDSGLMWAHYCSSHAGFCVGFDETHDFFSTAKNGSPFPARPVSYSDKRVQVPLEKDVPIDFEVMFRKSLDWKYEKEVRVLALLEHSKKIIGNGLWPICLFEVPHESVKEVVVGYKATDAVVAAVFEFSKTHECKPYRATISETTFDMIREPIKHNNQVNKDASR